MSIYVPDNTDKTKQSEIKERMLDLAYRVIYQNIYEYREDSKKEIRDIKPEEIIEMADKFTNYIMNIK